MIIKIENHENFYLLTNRVFIDYTVCGKCDEDFYNYESIICKTVEEVQNKLNELGYLPESAIDRKTIQKTEWQKSFDYQRKDSSIFGFLTRN